MLQKVCVEWLKYLHITFLLIKCIGFIKKVEKLAKQKESKIIGEWEKSLINHLYWSVVSTPSGNAEMIKAKWLSLDNHINNKHSGHDENFPRCSHGVLKGQDRNKKWFKRRKYNYASMLINVLHMTVITSDNLIMIYTTFS